MPLTASLPTVPSMAFRDTARLSLSDAGEVAAQVAAHLEEHGARLSHANGRLLLAFDFFRAELHPDGDGLEMEVAAADLSLLREVRALLAEHVLEFAEDEVGPVRWEVDLPAAAAPPNFRLMRVVAARSLTPHLRRITLSGEDLARFTSRSHYHCKLLIPPGASVEPEWPSLDADGRFVWPGGPGKPIVRKYTIRSVDLAASTLDIDFVLHEEPGPGAAWAAAAKPGDGVGVVGPGGRAGIAGDPCLLAGDETALPLLCRIAETLPAEARALMLVEVSGAAEEIPVASAARLDIRWLHRKGAAPGTTTLLEDAIRAVDWPGGWGSASAVVGCEHHAALDIRALLRREKGMPADRCLVVPYWRRGAAGA